MAVSFSLKFEEYSTGCQRISFSSLPAEQLEKNAMRLVGFPPNKMWIAYEEKYSKCETVERAETANGWFSRIFEIEKIFERKFFETGSCKGREFRTSERPGHLAFGVGGLAGAGNDEKKTTGTKESRNIFDGPQAESGRQNLESVGLKDKMESATPRRRRVEEVGGDVFHFRSGKAFAGSANRSFRNVEGRGTKAPGGELLGIVA